MSTVAFIGLGAMGSRMAANLLGAGFKLRVWNRDQAKTKEISANTALSWSASSSLATRLISFWSSVRSKSIPAS